MGDRIKLRNRAQENQMHKEESKGNGRGAAVAATKGGPKSSWLKANTLSHDETKSDDGFPTKIPTLQQICRNLGMTPEKQAPVFQPTLAKSTPPKKPIPCPPDTRWSIAALSGFIPSFSGGNRSIHCTTPDANISGAARPSSSLVAEKNETSRVFRKELASESAASWQVC